MKERKRRNSGRFFFSRRTQPDIDISSFMRSIPRTDAIPGDSNQFTSIESQIQAVLRRYQGLEPFGGPLTRAVVDARVGFIVSDGLSVACDDPTTREWAEGFLESSRFLTGGLAGIVRDGEIFGLSAVRLFRDVDNIYAVPVPQNVLSRIKVHFRKFSGWTSGIPAGFAYPVGEDEWEEVSDELSVVVIPSGNQEYPTRVGSIVTFIDNYDRCLFDLRQNNHVSARTTPSFKVSNSADAIQLKRQLSESGWKIGRAFVGQADFSYVSPEVSATENLIQEARILIETIAGSTGVPVHWLGHVEVMNNRSTADTLYESIKNATAADRAAWSSGIEELLNKARVLYVDAGFGSLNMSTTFDVQLPLVSFAEFRDRVAALSMAYSDDAISIDDYRNLLPGIDPLRTAEAVSNETSDSFRRRERIIEDVEDDE